MYQPIAEELVSDRYKSSNDSDIPMELTLVNSNHERDVFLDSFLSKNLNRDKLPEKDSIREKIKYKRHQLELASKHLKKEQKKSELRIIVTK